MKSAVSTVRTRQTQRPVTVPIMEFEDKAVRIQVLEKWQRVLDLVTQIFDVPSALVMRLHEKEIEVFAKSQAQGNPYHVHEKASLGSGLYCETVVGTDRALEVIDSLSDKVWQDNPDVELNMISYLGYPLKWPDGQFFGTLCVLDSRPREFTRRYKDLLNELCLALEKDLALIMQNLALQNSLSVLHRTQDQVIELEKSKLSTELISCIAHEINTPLGIAITTASVIEHLLKSSLQEAGNSEVQDKLQEGIELLNRNLQKAANLIGSYKQVIAEQGRGVLEKVNLCDYLHSIFTSMKHELGAANVKYSIDCPPEFILKTYPGLLIQVITILISNSLKHGFVGQPGGTIQVSAVQAKKTDGTDILFLDYCDSGVGIPKASVDAIFSPLFSAEGQSNHAGMGLSIARRLLENALAGSIRCDSQESNNGARFILTLPLLQ